MPTAHDVAREIRNLLPSAGRVKVQKLLYYCQGWHLAFTGMEMFPEPTEAWELGPVVREVYRADKYGEHKSPASELDDATQRTLHWVVAKYGLLSASDLVALTHSEDPWTDAWSSNAPSATISLDSMKAWFSAQIIRPEPVVVDPEMDPSQDEMPELLELLATLSA